MERMGPAIALQLPNEKDAQARVRESIRARDRYYAELRQQDMDPAVRDGA